MFIKTFHSLLRALWLSVSVCVICDLPKKKLRNMAGRNLTCGVFKVYDMDGQIRVGVKQMNHSEKRVSEEYSLVHSLAVRNLVSRGVLFWYLAERGVLFDYGYSFFHNHDYYGRKEKFYHL